VSLSELANADFGFRWIQIVILDLTLPGDNALAVRRRVLDSHRDLGQWTPCPAHGAILVDGRVGAAILGWVAGEMILGDRVVQEWLGGHPSAAVTRAVQGAFVILVVVGRAWARPPERPCGRSRRVRALSAR
jgi:hypothetical protein